MKKLIALLHITIVTVIAQGQTIVPNISYLKTKKEQLQRIATICDSLNYLEQYAKTQQLSRYALSMTDENDYYNRSLFCYYIGVSYQGAINDSAIYYYQKSLHDAQLAKNSKRTINALKELLYMYINVDGYTLKRDSTATLLNYVLDTTTNSDTRIGCYASLADYYSAIAWYEQELNYRLQGLELSVTDMKLNKYKETNADSTNIGVAYFNVGDLYEKLKQYTKAQEYYRSSKPLLWNYMAGICSYYKGMASTSLKLGDIANSQLFTDSLKIMVEQKLNISAGWNILFDLYLSNANYYLDAQKPAEAMPFLKEAEALLGNKVTENVEIAMFQYTMGKALTAQRNYSSALPYLQKAENLKDAFSTSINAELMRALANCYEGLNQWEKAAAYYNKYLPLRDSIDAKSARQSMANAEARYQNKEKVQEIEAQKTQIEFARKQRLWLLVGLSMLALSVLLLFIIYRNKRKTANTLDEKNKELNLLNAALNEANQTKAKLFSIIGHDLRSPISQVYQYLKLQQLNPNALNETQKAELNTKIQTATGSLLETMEDLLLWSKTQMNAFEIRIHPVEIIAVVNASKNLLQLNGDAKNISYKTDIPDALTVNTDTNYLQTIVRNLLQNAIKSAPANSCVHIYAKTDDNKTTLTIENEGAAFTQQDYEKAINDAESDKTLSGLGLKLVNELGQKINAKILYEATGDNTRVNIVFERLIPS